MLKKVIAFFTIVSILTLNCSYSVLSESEDIYLRVRGETLMNVNKVISTDSGFLVPLRPIANNENAEILWYDELKTADVLYKTNRTIIICGSNTFYKNGKLMLSQDSAQIINGTLYVGSDVIEATFGLTVYYNQGLKILDFKSAGTIAQKVDKNQELYDQNVVKVVAYEDAHVENATEADNNFGTSETVNFKFIPAGTRTFRKGYLKFDISGLPLDKLERVTFEGQITSAESSSVTVEGHMHEVDADAWKESTITWNTQPSVGKEVAVFAGLNRHAVGVDITEYIKEKMKAGQKKIAFEIDGSSTASQNASIASRENSNESYRPRLVFDYNDPQAYHIFDDYPVPEYGNNIAPLDNAKKMISESTATYKYGNDDLISYMATDSVQVTEQDDNSYFKATTMKVNYKNNSSKNTFSFIKYDLSELNASSVAGAYVQVYCTNTRISNDKRKIFLREINTNWNETGINWRNMPRNGNVIAVSDISSAKSWVKFDISDYLNEQIKAGNKTVAFMLDAYDNYETSFATRYSTGYEPKIFVLGLNEEAGSQKLVFKDYSSQYNESVLSRLSTQNDFSAKPTRLLASISDFKAQEGKPNVNKYGSDLNHRYDEGTGFFRVKKIDGRWRFIDPEGYFFYSAAKVNIRADDSFYDNVDDYDNKTVKWADEQRRFYSNYGFNSAGGWSFLFRPKNADGTVGGLLDLAAVDGENPMPMGSIVVYGVGIRYANAMGLATKDTTTQQDFVGGIPPVFNPDFEEKCNEIIKEYVTPWKDNPYIMGWWSDNEIADSISMLDHALEMDPYDERFCYTHAAAWEWLRQKTGKRNASQLDVNDNLREQFREFVYDRYYRIMSEAFHKYAPNHLYFGNRHFQFAETSPAIFKAAERYCDVMSVNLYRHWTPDIVDTWAEYADVPILITEWYANIGSAAGGFICRNTQDCGKFYQNFSLRLLEAKNVVGFHYFSVIYDDVMGSYAREINNNIYKLIEYFDK